jgi:hypothetical protein
MPPDKHEHVCTKKFTDRDLEDVLDAWERDLRFFQKGHDFQSLVMDALRKLCCCHDSLVWISGAVSATGEWRAFGAVRELYCRRYKPADQIEPSGYYDGEMRGIEQAGRKFFRELAEWKADQKLLPGEVPQPDIDKPKPPYKLGDIRRALFDPEGNQLRQSTLKDDEAQLEKDKQNVEPTRSPEDRARLIADLEMQLKRRIQKSDDK